ncbi:MAG: NAD(P)/FAD-dependent oxidoreductase [Clostridia bacterium]|nr:NAD(P)/FAD-dependent oxidoreductase [Clostridia bacterium]
MAKIIIIGAGTGGLVAGVYARKSGYDTVIYEKNAVPGGECTGWDREGCHIDNCIHWLMGTLPGSGLYDIWKTTGALGDGIEVLRLDNMYSSELNGERITLWADIERTRREMLALSPEDAVEINDLLDAAKLAEKVEIPATKPPEQMNLAELLHMAFRSRATLKLFKKYSGMDTQDLMNKFRHPLLKAVLSDFCTKESLAHSFPMSYGNFTGSDGGVPRGGSRAMALRMSERFKSLGGTLATNCPVEKVVIKGNRAVGVELSNGKTDDADFVICACDTDFTFNKLLPPGYMPGILREMYDNREAYPVYGMFQAAYLTDSPADALGGDVNIEAGEARFAEFASDRINVRNFAGEPDFAPKGKQIVQAMLGMTESGYDYWREIYEDKEKYARKKAEIAAAIMRVIEERFPEYKGKMKLIDAWTPMTYKRYCNAYKGYNQAFMITKKSRPNPYPPAFVEGVDNVLLCGQWLNPPGGLPGAATSGKFAIMRLNKALNRKIRL